ncbi:TPA: hypothetical protein ACUNF5_007570, partial [Burkholderia orbicola]
SVVNERFKRLKIHDAGTRFPAVIPGKDEKFSSDLFFCLNSYYAPLHTVSTVFFKIIRQF